MPGSRKYQLEQQIASLKKTLPYADGPNYDIQKHKIYDLEQKLKALKGNKS